MFISNEKQNIENSSHFRKKSRKFFHRKDMISVLDINLDYTCTFYKEI